MLSLAAVIASCGRTQFDPLVDAVGGAPGAGGSGQGGAGGGIGGGGIIGTGGRVGTGGSRTGGASGFGGSSVGGAGFGGSGVGGAGSGGAKGFGGTGGTQPPLCVPGSSQPCACTDGSKGAQVCLANGTFDNCVCTNDFERIRKGMTGTWDGVHSDPWVPSFKVTIVFGADGVYKGHCAQGTCPATVFSYGVDDDLPAKTYQLQSLNGDGSGSGIIQIAFDSTGSNVNTGELDEVVLSQDGSRLTFVFWPSWLGTIGPIKFDLARRP